MTRAALMLLLGALALGTAQAAPEEAMNKAGCMACHAKDKKIVGPSFKDIGAKYKGQDVAGKLAEKVRKGGSGSFGPIPMPPHPADKISDGDLNDAIAMILAS